MPYSGYGYILVEGYGHAPDLKLGGEIFFGVEPDEALSPATSVFIAGVALPAPQSPAEPAVNAAAYLAVVRLLGYARIVSFAGRSAFFHQHVLVDVFFDIRDFEGGETSGTENATPFGKGSNDFVIGEVFEHTLRHDLIHRAVFDRECPARRDHRNVGVEEFGCGEIVTDPTVS